MLRSKNILFATVALSCGCLPIIGYAEKLKKTEYTAIAEKKKIAALLRVKVKPSTIALIRHFEQSGREPFLKAYKDQGGIPTIATGFNLNRADAKAMLEVIDPNCPFDEIVSGEKELTKEQALLLEHATIAEMQLLVRSRVGKSTFEALSQEQRDSLISLAFNSPSHINKGMVRALINRNYLAVYKEIRYNSNPRGWKGIEKRREQESKPFLNEKALVPNGLRPNNHFIFR